ncbi:MAG: YoaK family protein [Saprospiraceae bacterium]
MQFSDFGNFLVKKQRRQAFSIKMLYAFVYPFNSGIVIYAGLMTFSVVVTNVTGLLPQIAKDLYEGRLNTAGSIFLWLFAFFMGGFVAGWCVEREKLRKWRYFHLLPLLIVASIFFLVGNSGEHAEGLHLIAFPGLVLFSIGIQNAMVSLTTSSLIKASQMTGVVNELGVDIAEIFHSEGEKRRLIQREAMLRVIVMVSFLLGALFSVAMFPGLQTRIFFFPAGIIGLVMVHDIWRF